MNTVARFFLSVFCGVSVTFLLGCTGDDKNRQNDNQTSVTQNQSAVSVETLYSNTASWDLDRYQGKPATAVTKLLQAKEQARLPSGDFLDGSLMSEHSDEFLVSSFPKGIGAMDVGAYGFVEGERPDTLHPSIYADMKERYKESGLYKLGEGLYQIRGDLAHITLVRGAKGWIVLDTGITADFAKEAWQYVHELLPGGRDVPISTVIYSHSHIDHFGGVKGLVSQEDVDSGRVEIIAPYGFMAQALAENVIAGSAMMRRAQYHFGSNLEVKSDGTELFFLNILEGKFTLIAPTYELPQGQGDITTRQVDGVQFQFKDISSAEAPAATLMFLPEQKLLFNSELMFKGLHNVYTLRGALVRDALAWSKLIDEVIQDFGREVEMITGPHGPSFSGNEKINEYMALQRDNYGFIHNQSVRLINSGMKLQDVGTEVASIIPETLGSVWHTRGYHGTYSHNARGVVNRYLGFYDGNPANLNPLPIKKESEKFVEYMGGAESILERAQKDFSEGNYQFVATVVNKLVTFDPDNWPARHLLADAYEQLGYQSEGPQWRNAYLTAAKELRLGKVLIPPGDTDQSDLLGAATISDVLDLMAVKVDVKKADGKSIRVNLIVTDTQKKYELRLMNGNLTYRLVNTLTPADVNLTFNQSDMRELLSGKVSVGDMIKLGVGAFDGSPFALVSLLNTLDKSNPYYPMIPMPTE